MSLIIPLHFILPLPPINIFKHPELGMLEYFSLMQILGSMKFLILLLKTGTLFLSENQFLGGK